MRIKNVIGVPEWDFVCIETEFTSHPSLTEIMRIASKRVGYCVVDGGIENNVDIFLKRGIKPETMRDIFTDLAKYDHENQVNKYLVNEMNVEDIKNTLKKFMD